MTSNDRRASLSPGERSRAKSQSSSRSQRTTPNLTVHEEDGQQRKMSSRTSQRTTREIDPSKRSESSASTRSAKTPTPTSAKPTKQRPSVKTPTRTSPTARRRSSSKRKKSMISVTELERQQILEQNDSEKQNHTGVGLAMVPAEIFQLATLRRLILSNNNLSGLPPAIGSLHNLEYLDISQNPLLVRNGHDDYSCFPREFRHLKNLHTLIMRECGLKHIPVAVWFIVSLQSLDLSRNKVGFLMSEIGNLTDVRHLHLSYMDLDTLPAEIGFCDKLETLDVMGNPIDNLPETLVECRQLYQLKINFKTFYKLLDNYMFQLVAEGKIRSEHIPQVIFELESLRVLDLSRTKTNSFPTGHTLASLTELHLSNNFFFDIPESICMLAQLRTLDLSHNRLTTIPDYFERMTRLEILILSFNKLTVVSKAFGRLPVLHTLIARHNQLHTIDKEFCQSTSLIELDLSYNNLTHIPDELCRLTKLETLDLRYNKIERLPLIMRQMIGLKSMNLFAANRLRTGLHLSGNAITDPPSYIWKSTDIRTLYNYFEDKEKRLKTSFYHLKIILIGPKNVGKTTFARKLVHDRKAVSKTRTTVDMFLSILQQKSSQSNRLEDLFPSQTGYESSRLTSSTLTDQWIENGISTNDDDLSHRPSKAKRTYPPLLKTYRSSETNDDILQKSTLITKNNFHFTILDLTSQPSFEILYPLVYDSKAVYMIPVNLTLLLQNLPADRRSEISDSEEHLSSSDQFDAVLTDDWLYRHVLHYIESIADRSTQVSLAIIGLVDQSQLEDKNAQQQELLDAIHAKVQAFLVRKDDRRDHVHLYSNFFPVAFHLDDEEMSTVAMKHLESLAQQWNIVHHKQKRLKLRQRFRFIPDESIIVEYNACLKHFEQQAQAAPIPSDEDDDETSEEEQQWIKDEVDPMSFDECLDYLQLVGDILCFGHKPQMILIFQPSYLLNQIFARTLFRSHLDQWLNYDTNMIFRFSGYYPTEEQFTLDCQRLFTRGEFTWNMLNVLFFAQNNQQIGLTEQSLIDYCRLMERLHLGYSNQSNCYHPEFSIFHFVCPWFIKETSADIDGTQYFKSLEQSRKYETLRIERARRVKQQQLWFSMDVEKENIEKETLAQTNTINSSPKPSSKQIYITIPELPALHDIPVFDSQIINQDALRTMKIINRNSNALPEGLYEHLLICLHPLLQERLDYHNLTLGRTIDKNLIKIERFDEQNQVHLTINNNLIVRVQSIITQNLFAFYPSVPLRIET